MIRLSPEEGILITTIEGQPVTINSEAEVTINAEGAIVSDSQVPLTLNQMLERAERDALVHALRLSSGHVADAAEILGIPAKTLYDKLARFSIAVTDFKT